jgi:hypothetical protein
MTVLREITIRVGARHLTSEGEGEAQADMAIAE